MTRRFPPGLMVRPAKERPSANAALRLISSSVSITVTAILSVDKARNSVTSAANSAWCWNRNPGAASGSIFSRACGISPTSRRE